MNYLLSGTFTTKSPLSHISESISTGSLLNERAMLQSNGELIDVFCYNGNAWRGQLRDLAALYLIEKLDITELKIDIHNFLFSGGKIGGQSKFKLENVRKHFELLPAFSLMGGCLDNMMLPGKLSVFDALPLCQEAIIELPQSEHTAAVENSYKRMVIEREFTRMDDSKNMQLNDTLSAEDFENKETVQMRMGGELLNSGVDLFTRILARDSSLVELGALCSALAKFADNPFIGGQHNKGHGKVDIAYSINNQHFFAVNDFDIKTSDLFTSALAAYDEHLIANQSTILELLQ